MLPVVDCYYILCYKTSFHTCKRATFSSVALFIPSVALPLPAVHPQSNVRLSCDKREIVCGFAGGELAVNIDYAGRGARVVEMLERRK